MRDQVCYGSIAIYKFFGLLQFGSEEKVTDLGSTGSPVDRHCIWCSDLSGPAKLAFQVATFRANYGRSGRARIERP
jgi:hypothetical protein